MSAGDLITTERYISTVDLIQMPEIRNDLFKRFGDQLRSMMFDFEFMRGRKEVTKQPTFSWHEERRIANTFTSEALVADPGAGNPVTITIPDAEHVNSGANSLPIVGRLVQFPNRVIGRIHAKDTTTANAHTVTIEPLRAADNIGAVAAGSKIVMFSNAWGEGTGQPNSITPTPLKFDNKLQIVKSTYEFTGTVGATVSWMEIENSKGEKAARWYYQGEYEQFFRFMQDRELAMLLGVQADAAFADANGVPVRTTRGLLSDIRTNGNPLVASTFSMATIDNMIQIANQQRAAHSHLLYCGDTFHLNVSNVITEQMKEDNINYEVFADPQAMNGGKERAAIFGFDSFRKAGYTFFMKTLDTYSNPEALGAAGFPYRNSAFTVPANDVTYLDAAKARKTGKALVIRHLEGRDMEHWQQGAGTQRQGQKDGDLDTTKLHYRCEIGLEARGLSGYFLLED